MEKETYLTFVLGQEYFAVNVKKVLEVLERQQITPIPKAPEHILGIINFRGDILPVANTRYKFNLEKNDSEAGHLIIVYDLSFGDNRFCIAATADAVKDVIEIDKDEIKPVPEMGISYDVRYINGVIRRNELFILILDIETFLTTNELQILKQPEQQNILTEQ